MHHHDDSRRNIIQCITKISPAQQVTILNHVQIITMRTLGGVGAMHKNLPIMLALCLLLFSTYYAQNYASIIGAGLIESRCHKA